MLEGKTDALGQHNLGIHFEAMNPPRPMNVRAEATVVDVNRQAWTAKKELLVHPASLYVGLKTERGYVAKDDPIDIEALVVDIDGKVVPGVDIALSMAAGFNGARLHQKVFEERFHYWADRLGYLTWGESSSWGIDVKDQVSARNFIAEWREIVVRDRNHPSIIAWTPFNETHDTGDGRQHNRLHADAYALTHDLDPTRPVNDASGYVHVVTDLWTVHTYQQDPAFLREELAVRDGQVMRRFPEREAAYGGQPYIVDEFGGIKWIPSADQQYVPESWGYGVDPQTLDEFYTRLEGLVEAILSYDHICGYCYTQLTDVEQEQNGVYNYDRTPKFDMARIQGIFARTPDR